MFSRGISILLYITFIHLVGLYLFTSGFLLTRLSLSQTTSCEDTSSCTLPTTHPRLVFLIIDALRFDFISPSPPLPASPHHHDVLTLPRELSAKYPDRSFIFNAHADPPTTTLQRIKGLTTGSLPTFIDMGSNFAGSSVVEDSIITQMERAGKKIAFMGDDTWLSVFPSSFAPNMTFPYDSFNVEDLHTVDTGVTTHLLPLLRSPQQPKPWDVLIGHFLGVDHVGHRVGPDHPIMHAKLTQMNDVLTDVVSALDDDTLLVLIGDHGMDAAGDHGGDGTLEVSSAVWIYSKNRPLFAQGQQLPGALLPKTTFPRAPEPHRAIQQIDLVPTLALLMGLPIPFNNLGAVVPELFARGGKDETLVHALELNAEQVHGYLDTYRASASGGELDGAWDELQDAWAESRGGKGHARMVALNEYVRLALTSCRVLWAQFNVVLMNMGLLLLGVGVLTGWAVYSRLGEEWEEWLGDKVVPVFVKATAGGSVMGLLTHLALGSHLQGITAVHCVLFGGSFLSAFVLLFHTARPKLSLVTFSSIPLALVIHALAFFSNSFTVWEDHIVSFMLLSTLVPSILVGFQAPTTRLRYRILGFSGVFALCVRLMALSTACREEQHSYCSVTFYASSSSSPPTLALLLVFPTAVALPYIVWRFLRISGSDEGVAKPYLAYFLAPSLVAGSAFWVLEWAEVAGVLGTGARLWRTCIAWFPVAVAGIALALWWAVPLCMRVVTDDGVGKGKGGREVTVLGFANAYGAPFLVFWCIPFGVVYLATQVTGQLVLALGAVALMAHLEVRDSVRDVRGMEMAFSAAASPTAAINMDTGSMPVFLTPITLADMGPIALLGLHAFFGTGHQASIPSIQWKSAFLLSSTVTYPLSPLTVVLNTCGAQFLFALAVPLLASWNVPPLPSSITGRFAQGQTLRAGLGMMLWNATLLVGAAGGAGLLRRHLMVWKIFAPRFMLAGVGVVVVDVAVLLAAGVFGRVRGKVDGVFGGVGGKGSA